MALMALEVLGVLLVLRVHVVLATLLKVRLSIASSIGLLSAFTHWRTLRLACRPVAQGLIPLLRRLRGLGILCISSSIALGICLVISLGRLMVLG